MGGSRRRAGCTRRSERRGSRWSRGTRLPNGRREACGYIAAADACKGTLTTVSTPEILLLGAIAGVTIFLGLPIGRMQDLSPNARAGLSALATGILVFLLWDVLVERGRADGLGARRAPLGPVRRARVLGIVGFTAGLMSLVYYESWMKQRAGRRSSPLVGPGAAAVDEFAERRHLDLTNPAMRLSFLIAIGIGVHNFGEGLAIGQAAASSEISLAVTLIIGFGLHNATEGFGICGPLTGEGIVPSWRLLAAARPDRRRADLLRHRRGSGVDERGGLGPLLHGRRRLDPLRRPGAVRRQPQVRPPGAGHHGSSSPGSCSASRRTSSSAPPASSPFGARRSRGSASLRRRRPAYGRHPSRGPLAENVRVFRSPSCSFASSDAPRSRSSSSVSGFRRNRSRTLRRRVTRTEATRAKACFAVPAAIRARGRNGSCFSGPS